MIGHRYLLFVFLLRKHNISFSKWKHKNSSCLFPTYFPHLHVMYSGAPLQDKQLWCLLSAFSLIVRKPKRSETTAEQSSDMTVCSLYFSLSSLFFLSLFYVVSHPAYTLRTTWVMCCSILANCDCLYVAVLVQVLPWQGPLRRLRLWKQKKAVFLLL